MEEELVGTMQLYGDLLYHQQKIRQATAERKAYGKSFLPEKNPGGWGKITGQQKSHSLWLLFAR
jgi:hypothetical protein